MATKKRLIDANALRSIAENSPCCSSDGSLSLEEIRDFIDAAPTVDAVEVVRCKDCVVWKRREDGLIKCPYCTDLKREDDFCSRGERKNDG